MTAGTLYLRLPYFKTTDRKKINKHKINKPFLAFTKDPV